MSSEWIWVDFENTPHVLFLEPFVRALRQDGWPVVLTAKPQSQTVELATSRGLIVETIGAGELTSLAQKVLGGLGRTARLLRWVLRQGKPRLVISSSRTAGLVARLLGIQGIAIVDYEHSEHRTLALGSASVWLPDVLRTADLPWFTARVARFFAGLKENLYLDAWPQDREGGRRSCGITSAEYFVVARPPADTAHYAEDRSGSLWFAVLKALSGRPEVTIVAVARNDRQRARLRADFTGVSRARVLDTTVDGPALVSAADLVVGGGGTMNREAAVLGVPVWSVFTGPTPHVDACLNAEGRLRWIRTDKELAAALAGPLPGRLPGRGPYPDGFASILADIRSRLGAAP